MDAVKRVEAGWSCPFRPDRLLFCQWSQIWDKEEGRTCPNFVNRWWSWFELAQAQRVGQGVWLSRHQHLCMVRQANADELGGGRSDAPLTTAERQELAQLRRQLRQVTQERDILAKATAWFANKDSGIGKTSMR